MKPVSPQQYEYIKCIGYNPKYAHACGKLTDITKVSPKMFARVSEMFPDADLKAFGKIQGTFHTTMNALKKYDHNKQFNVSFERRKQIIETFQLVHKEMAQSINTLTDYDVSMKMSLNKSPGRLYTSLDRNPKIRTKFDAICECWGIIQQLARDPNFETLFQGSAKTERIKIIKILEKDPRLFITVSMEFVWRGMILFSEISDYMFSKADNFNYPWKIGMQMIHGSLFGLFQTMNNYTYKSDDDVKKWDSSFLNESFDMIADLKKWMHNPHDPNMSQFDYEVLVDSYYSSIKSPCVVMPDGHIYQLRCGQMSGLYTTGQDNSLNHELIKIYEYLEILGSPTAYSQSYLTEFNFGIVGDDIVNGTNFFVPPEHTERCYADFGFQVKIAESHRSKDISGLRFCSFVYLRKLDWNSSSGLLDPVYDEQIIFDRNKILCSLVNEPIPLTKSRIDVYITRISMLCLLAAFDDKLCNFLIDVYFDMRKEYKAQITPSYVMDPSYLRDLWSGGECNLSKYIPNYFFQNISKEYNLFFEYSKRTPHCLIPDVVEWNQEDIQLEEIDVPFEIVIVLEMTCVCGFDDFLRNSNLKIFNIKNVDDFRSANFPDYCPKCYIHKNFHYKKLYYKKRETNITHPALRVQGVISNNYLHTFYSDHDGQAFVTWTDEMEHFRYQYILAIFSKIHQIHTYYRDHENDFNDGDEPEFLDYFLDLMIKYHSNIYWLMDDPDPMLLSNHAFHEATIVSPDNLTVIGTDNWRLNTYVAWYNQNTHVNYIPHLCISPSTYFNFRDNDFENMENRGLIEELDNHTSVL